MHTSSNNVISPNNIVTPDLIIEVPASEITKVYHAINEIKINLGKVNSTWMNYVEQLQKYHDVLLVGQESTMKIMI